MNDHNNAGATDMQEGLQCVVVGGAPTERRAVRRLLDLHQVRVTVKGKG